MRSPFIHIFFLLAAVSQEADSILVGGGSDKPSPSLTKQQFKFIRDKLKIELNKNEDFSSQLEDLKYTPQCRNSIDPSECAKTQDDYQIIKDKLSRAVVRNLIKGAINRQGTGENAALVDFNQNLQEILEQGQGVNETISVFGGNVTAEEFERQKFLADIITPVNAALIHLARSLGLAKQQAYKQVEPYLLPQVKYLFDKNNQRQVANTAELWRIVFSGGLTMSLGIRDLFRVIYYFNDWVDDPVAFDIFNALFNFGYRQKIREDGVLESLG